MKNEQLEREDGDNNINKTISDEFSRYIYLNMLDYIC